ncbi:YggS family pyridoxal phosphate-dependent enzyme [bacterium]|nr:YggS family pyridoxal phosphate-dependent enzyme [bacterium]
MIKENVRLILNELKEGVELVAAAKTRTANEILEAIDAGVKIIGENYFQELRDVYDIIGNKVKWHFIGHLQTNKVKYVVEMCDMVETLDSIRLAAELDKRCRKIGKVMPVLIEINSGKEEQKSGVLPANAISFIRNIVKYTSIKVMGLMTMGPLFGDPENARPYFRKTKTLFEQISDEKIPGIEMKYLSMGMTNSYKVAIEEGSNMVRIGTKIFGAR